MSDRREGGESVIGVKEILISLSFGVFEFGFESLANPVQNIKEGSGVSGECDVLVGSVFSSLVVDTAPVIGVVGIGVFGLEFFE